MDATRARGDLSFLQGGGEMGRLMREHDWQATAVGWPPTWPQGLRTAVRLMLNARHPMYIFWGPHSVCFYNDAYGQSLGPEQHPASLGRPGSEVWDDIWHMIGPQVDQVQGGHGATWHENQRVPITRNGQLEDSWWTYSYGPIDDVQAETGIGGVLVVCTETTRQVALTRGLATAKERLDQALSAGGGIGTWDWDVVNDRVYADERFCTLYGVDPRKAEIGAPLPEFFRGIHPDDLPALQAQIDAALKGAETLNAEYRLVGRDGAESWVAASGRCEFDALRRPVRLAGVSMDVTARRAAEEELKQYRDGLEAQVRQRTADLEQANLALEHANGSLMKSRDEAQKSTRAKSAFLANMSHEIRTPMNAIIGLTHLVSRSKLDAYQRERIGEVSAAARHLLELIDDILDLSKIEAGMMVLDDAEFSTAELIDGALGMVSERAKAKGLRLEVDAGELPGHLRGDKVKLSQITINLLSNAVKFTETGTVRLRARILEEDSERVHILMEVEDTGPGIAVDHQALLFNAFEQADNSLSRKHGGTGLGLALSRQLSRAMGGDTSFSSVPGVGSTFRFTAWLERGCDREQAAGAASDARTPWSGEAEALIRQQHGGQRILLAEDNPINRFVAQELLRSAGLLVETAADGAAAVAMVRAHPFDLVLMDMQMPELDGLEATRALRDTGHLLPIVAMTANAYIEDRLACLAAGMNDHVTKPVEPEALFSILVRWLPARPPRPGDGGAPRED